MWRTGHLVVRSQTSARHKGRGDTLALSNHLQRLLAVVVNFTLSAVGSLLLFRLLHSSATISGTGYEAGGALAGFLLLYWILHRSFCKLLILQEPSLTPRQTLDLLTLFQESVKARVLRVAFAWIDDVEAGREIPPLETRLQIINATRHQPRQYITGFTTPLPDFYRHVEEKGESTLFKDTVMEGMKLIESKTVPAAEKRRRLEELADSLQSHAYNEYVQDLVKVGRLWPTRREKNAEQLPAADPEGRADAPSGSAEA